MASAVNQPVLENLKGPPPQRLYFSPLLIRQYEEGQLTLRDVAEMYGVTHTTIGRRFKEMGVPRRPQNKNPWLNAKVLKLRSEGHKYVTIAARCGVTWWRVRQIVCEAKGVNHAKTKK